MSINLTILKNDTKIVTTIEENSNLLAALKQMNVYIPLPCGGNGKCGKCKCKVISGYLEPSSFDMNHFSQTEIHEGYRLLCSANPSSDLSIQLFSNDESKFEAITYYLPSQHSATNLKIEKINLSKDKTSIAQKITNLNSNIHVSYDILKECSKIADEEKDSIYVTYYDGNIAKISDNEESFYGIAIDIGTTTIGFGLVDLKTSEIISNISLVNKQREYGADVITRIIRSNNGDLDLLHKIIKDQLIKGILQIITSNEINKENILNIAITGNTTMLHLLLGLSPRSLGAFPFTPITLDLMVFDFKEIFSEDLNCKVTILPGISAYVGADISSGIFFSQMNKNPNKSFLLDIGTNGEMALWNGEKLLCTSTAAGPAFEGGNILWGTGSIPGAISQVKYENGNINIKTIADKPPIGICGSGIIDAVAECLINGLINKRGMFNNDLKSKGLVLGKNLDGEEILLTQKDIKELQMGKSAIRSGIDSLINHFNLKYEDIDTLYLAGGFGYKINLENACLIGLIPRELKDKIVLLGNSSLGGAIKYLLQDNSKDELKEIIEISDVYELSTDKDFQDTFIDNFMF